MRDYRSGDPLQAIDWKSSARVGSLQVKKYEPAVSLTTVIFLDLNAAAYARQLKISASEWAIVVAASLASYLVGQRQAVGLASNGMDPLTGSRGWIIPARPGRTHLMKLLEWLARVQQVEATPLADWLPTAAVGLAWGTTVVAITPSGDEATCTALHRLRRAGLNPVLVAVEPHGQFGVVQERGRRLGVLAYLVADEDDLKRWQGGPVRARCDGRDRSSDDAPDRAITAVIRQLPGSGLANRFGSGVADRRVGGQHPRGAGGGPARPVLLAPGLRPAARIAGRAGGGFRHPAAGAS